VEFDGVSTFFKSGLRRIRDAERLLEPPSAELNEQGADTRHLRGAMYLSGYGVECLLKAYLIQQQPGCTRLSDALVALRRSGAGVRDIGGSAGHDLPYLLTLTKPEARFDRTRRVQMSHCAKWRSSWRYDPSVPKSEDAAAMVNSARAMVEWIVSQM
jgi:hypothetical protein